MGSDSIDSSGRAKKKLLPDVEGVMCKMKKKGAATLDVDKNG